MINRSIKMLVIAALVSLAFSAQAAELTVDDVITKLQTNQTKIHDMYAETTTTMTSNMTLPGQESKGPQKMVQTAKMWTKGQDKSKLEQLTPTRQITITNGDQMAIIDPESGQKTVQDLKKMKGQGIEGASGQGKMSLDKAKEFFDLSIRKLDALMPGNLETFVITGIPKNANKFLGKMEIYVDGAKWLPVKIVMSDPKSRPMSQTTIDYSSVEADSGTIFVSARNSSVVSSPMGKMEVVVEYNNIKVNEGISDKEFVIE